MIRTQKVLKVSSVLHKTM